MYNQEDKDRIQEQALCDRGWEDLYYMHDDDTSLEYVLSNSEQEDLFDVDEDSTSVGDNGGSFERIPLDTHGLA